MVGSGELLPSGGAQAEVPQLKLAAGSYTGSFCHKEEKKSSNSHSQSGRRNDMKWPPPPPVLEKEPAAREAPLGSEVRGQGK